MASLLLTDESRRIPLQTGADFETNSQMLSWWFAGVTVLADWLGSNTNFFSYQQQEQDLEEYWSAVKRKQTVHWHIPVVACAGQAGETDQGLFHVYR
jgi:CRISPR-associated endonuclease/helicase Cas3